MPVQPLQDMQHHLIVVEKRDIAIKIMHLRHLLHHHYLPSCVKTAQQHNQLHRPCSILHYHHHLLQHHPHPTILQWWFRLWLHPNHPCQHLQWLFLLNHTTNISNRLLNINQQYIEDIIPQMVYHHPLSMSGRLPLLQVCQAWWVRKYSGMNIVKWLTRNIIDQLSKRTFGTAPTFTFPPYPLTPSPHHPQQPSAPPTASSPSSTAIEWQQSLSWSSSVVTHTAMVAGNKNFPTKRINRTLIPYNSLLMRHDCTWIPRL